jgi:hypothetical protein
MFLWGLFEERLYEVAGAVRPIEVRRPEACSMTFYEGQPQLADRLMKNVRLDNTMWCDAMICTLL